MGQTGPTLLNNLKEYTFLQTEFIIEIFIKKGAYFCNRIMSTEITLHTEMCVPYFDLAEADGYCSSAGEAFYHRVGDELQQEACRET